MDDDQIRTIVREVLASRGLRPGASALPDRLEACRPMTMVAPTPSGSPCVIEPAVTCNHCGYCLALGH